MLNLHKVYLSNLKENSDSYLINYILKQNHESGNKNKDRFDNNDQSIKTALANNTSKEYPVLQIRIRKDQN